MYLIGNFYVPTFEAAGIGDQMDFFQFPTINEGVGVLKMRQLIMHIPAVQNVEDAKFKIYK